ncbi:hypothetical protein RHSIM_Rhsim06G0023200 [Rhododendron simsii]|uniref:Uncharacterized protein n=1 Tax=Rhododendron simsii TaxID=118357 RepID=A0A834GYB6_RHOSS|nr:hypothetical protein RHSIM_Rhsim06G0023200 [Rhododendron simsii]
MLRRWRKKASTAAKPKPSSDVPSGHLADVPSGHLAVCVGASSRRFVVRATYLNHPAFGKLLDQAQEEYGYANSGPLAIPCDEVLFEELLGYLGRTESGDDKWVVGELTAESSRLDERDEGSESLGDLEASAEAFDVGELVEDDDYDVAFRLGPLKNQHRSALGYPSLLAIGCRWKLVFSIWERNWLELRLARDGRAERRGEGGKEKVEADSALYSLALL